MKILISIDDVSPHPKSSVEVLRQCEFISKSIPKVKFSLFVPIAYHLVLGEFKTARPLFLSEHNDFLREIKSLDPNVYELCWHGFYHSCEKISNNDEFKFLSEQDALKKFELMEKEAQKSGIGNKFKKVFRPPAWKLSSGSVKASQKYFDVLALSRNLDYDLSENKLKICYYDACPPFDPIRRLEKLHIVYHASQWNKNFLSLKMAEDLVCFLKEQDVCNFCNFEQFVS